MNYNINLSIVVRNITRNLAFLLLIVALSSCGDEEVSPPQPEIISISPAKGVGDMEIKITGNNFNANHSLNTVMFNGVKALIKRSTDTELTVISPKNATTGPIVVTTEAGTIAGPIFKYYDIYVVMSEFNNEGKQIIKVWRNGNTEILSDGIRSASANSFTVSGEDVYVAGISLDDHHRPMPAYWKNNSSFHLTNDIRGFAWDIAVAGNDVYVAGNVHNGTHYTPKYWKNGEEFDLGDGIDGYAGTIALNGNDVYVGGYITRENNVLVGTYWKNGNANYLPSSKSTYINDIYVDANSNIHILAQELTGELSNSFLQYWRNGITKKLIAKNLTDGSHHVFARCMKIIGNDVIIAGTEDNDQNVSVGKLWINDRVITLTDGSASIYISGMTVIDDDILVAGQFNTNRGGTLAFYAINDAVFFLSNGQTSIDLAGIYAR